MAQCEEIRPSGYRCINPAQHGRTVCASHDPRRQCGAASKNGGMCKRMKVQGHSTCSLHR